MLLTVVCPARVRARGAQSASAASGRRAQRGRQMLDLITPTHKATLARAPIKVNTINATMTKIPFEHGNFYIIITAFGAPSSIYMGTSAPAHNALSRRRAKNTW
jgi:hypothetical protein